jgi:DNA-binding NtrC family response regulator
MNQPVVLIVDDEPLVTGMLRMVLELGLTAEVVTTNSPLHAREILRREKISLLLTDYLMPELNGVNLIRFLREQGSTIPVLLLTGYCDEPELALNTEKLKPFEVIVKPWSNEHLVARIKTWLDGAEMSAGA